MAASARLMVLMSPEERASLDTKARTELRALIDVFNEIHPETLRMADECHRKVEEAMAGPSRRDPASRRREKTAAA